MIHELCKCYGIDKQTAMNYNQIDYWEMRVFENLSAKREIEYLNKNKNK